jgi:hypothetical protein
MEGMRGWEGKVRAKKPNEAESTLTTFSSNDQNSR